jgi:hypothetical protein
MYAVQSGQTPKILTLLVNNADINAKAKDGSTALKIAERTGRESIALMLKQCGAVE